MKRREVVIALCVTPLKIGRLNWGNIPVTSQETDLAVTQYPRKVIPIAPIDFTDDTKVGKIDVLVCKLTDLMTADATNATSLSEIAAVEGYIARHPEVIVIDPASEQRKLVSRALLCGSFERLQRTAAAAAASSLPCDFPRSKTGGAEGLRYPVFCKPEGASGNAGHRMVVAFGPRGVSEFAATKEAENGFVCQEYVNHGARLFKAFYIGGRLYTQERPSLPDLEPWDGCGEEPRIMHFDNTKAIGPQVEKWSRVRGVQAQVKAPEEEDFRKIGGVVVEEFDLTLYGLDVITDANTGKFVVIDINYFPSYKGCATCGEVFDNIIIHLEKSNKLKL